MIENDVVLQAAVQSDLIKIHRWLNSEIILKYFCGRDHDRPSLEDIENDYGPQTKPDLLMIYYKNKAVGFIDVFEFDSDTKKRHGLSENEKNVLSFDIVIGETQAQNIGIGSTAVNKLLHMLFCQKTANKVVLDTYIWHKQAIHCYEKCGFRTTRVLRNHEKYEGTKADDVFMEITKQEYTSLQASGFLLETDRLIIRNFKPSDASDLFEYLSLPEIYQFEPGDPISLETAFKLSEERSQNSDFLAVVLKDSLKMIGHLYFKQTDPDCFMTWELGFIFNPKYQNMGYCSESSRKLLEYAFTTLHAHRIEAFCNPLNPSSWHVLENIGLKKEGLFPQKAFFRKDQHGNPLWHDCLAYGIIESDWFGK